MSQIKLSKWEIIGIAAGGTLIFGGLLWKSASSKEEPEQIVAEPRDVTEELTGRPSETGTVDLNVGSSDSDKLWKTYDGDGGKRSRRKQRKNKSKKSRPKSKRRSRK
jgi:hypothetical protein